MFRDILLQMSLSLIFFVVVIVLVIVFVNVFVPDPLHEQSFVGLCYFNCCHLLCYFVVINCKGTAVVGLRPLLAYVLVGNAGRLRQDAERSQAADCLGGEVGAVCPFTV